MVIKKYSQFIKENSGNIKTDLINFFDSNKQDIESKGLNFQELRENFNIFCSIVMYPVVPKGVIMLRLIPTAMHTLEDVEYTIKSFIEIKKNQFYMKQLKKCQMSLQ